MLIVDDEKEMCETLKFFFEEIPNLKVITANSGNQGLEITKNQNVDLILSDIRMPDGDGVSLLKGTDLTNTTFYFMSGFTEFQEEQLISLGAKGVINKPFDIPEIVKLFKPFLNSI